MPSRAEAARILGFTTGPGIFEFDSPVHRFGAWWNNNSGASGATVEFMDESGEVFATVAATNPAPGNVWTNIGTTAQAFRICFSLFYFPGRGS